MRKHDESIKEFVSEAEEIIEELNQNLREIEAGEKRGDVQPELINTIFRGAHSLKGMSGMVGLKKVSELSHRMEDLLDKLRMGRVTLNSAVVEALFKSTGVLQDLVRSVSAGRGEATDIAPLLKQIERIITGDPSSEAGGDLSAQGVDPELLKLLTEYETHRLAANLKSGVRLFEITVHFKLESFDKDLTKLNSKLKSIGEVISTLPTAGMSSDQEIGFKLILGSRTDPETLRSQLGGDSLEIREIAVRSRRNLAPEESSSAPSEGGELASIRSLAPTLRVDIGKLDGLLNIVGELVMTKAVIHQIGTNLARERGFSAFGVELQKASHTLDRRLGEFQQGLIEIRMIPLGQVFDRLIRVIRKLSGELGKEVDLQISGEETKLDKSMIEEMADPLMHLITNAMDHGIEPVEERKTSGKPEVGVIRLRAVQKGNSVVIEVEDDGAGIDLARVYQKGLEQGLLEKDKQYDRQELLSLLFVPGFSTAASVTEVSGRGVGLDVVAKNIAKLNGMVDVETESGRGTRFSITLPITLVIIKALIVRVGAETFAVPLNSISEILMVDSKDIRTVERREVVQLRGQTLSLVRLRDLFGLEGPSENLIYAIVVGLAEKRLALAVDAVEGQQEIVIKSLGEILKDVPGVAGATELGNSKTILVLDTGTLIEEAIQSRSAVQRHRKPAPVSSK